MWQDRLGGICLAVIVCLTSNASCTKGDSAELPEYMHPGVRTGAVLLRKKVFLDLPDLGTITDIQFGGLQPGTTELGVAANFGAKFFDLDRHLLDAVSFGSKRASTIIVRATSSTSRMFLRQEGSLGGSDGLAGMDGTVLWKVPYPCRGSTLDYSGVNGAPEFFFAARDRALEARDASGHVIWRKQGTSLISGLHIVEGSNKRSSQLLVNWGGELVAVGPKGDILSERKPRIDVYFSDFNVVRWPTVCDQCLLVSEADKFRLLNIDGDRLVKDLGPANYLSNARGIAVRLRENEGPFLVIAGLVEYKVPSEITFYSGLYVFNAKGKPLYYEVLPERVEALAVLPSSDGKREALLVGGEGRVWEYASR